MPNIFFACLVKRADTKVVGTMPVFTKLDHASVTNTNQRNKQLHAALRKFVPKASERKAIITNLS